MKHTLSVLVEDESGALSRISGLFARRGFNIDSLAVGPAESKGISRLTMVVEGDDETLQQMTKQLNKLFNVLGVVDFTNLAAVERELMLLKVSSKEDTRSNILYSSDIPCKGCRRIRYSINPRSCWRSWEVSSFREITRTLRHS